MSMKCLGNIDPSVFVGAPLQMECNYDIVAKKKPIIVFVWVLE